MTDEMLPINETGKCDGCGCPVEPPDFYCNDCLDREDLFGLVGGTP